MRHITLGVTCLLVCLVLSPSVEAVGESKVGSGVREGLVGAERVRVVVYLSIAPTDGRNLELLRARVSTAQQSVLGRVDADEFVLKQRFQNIPSLAGEVKIGRAHV